MLLNNQQVTEESKREIKKFLETNDSENNNSKPMGCSKSSPKREDIQSYLKKQEKHQIDNLTLHLKQLREKRTTTTTKIPKISRRKEIKDLTRNKWKRNEINNSKE